MAGFRGARGAIALVLALAASSAQAGEPGGSAASPAPVALVTTDLGLQGGYATNPNATGSNLYGLGFGLHGGIVLRSVHLYVGLRSLYFVGGSAKIVFPGGMTDVGHHALLNGAEVGYEFTRLPHVVLRPQIGAGAASFSVSSSNPAAGIDTSGRTNAYVEPGLTALFPIGIVYAGLHAGLLVVPGASDGIGGTQTLVSFAATGQVGVRF